jgi:hypothetical protein
MKSYHKAGDLSKSNKNEEPQGLHIDLCAAQDVTMAADSTAERSCHL